MFENATADYKKNHSTENLTFEQAGHGHAGHGDFPGMLVGKSSLPGITNSMAQLTTVTPGSPETAEPATAYERQLQQKGMFELEPKKAKWQ